MKRLLQLSFSLFLFGVLVLPAELTHAQDRSNDKAQTVIEIKDGKVYMNGMEIAELEDSDASVLFKRSGDAELMWPSSDNYFEARSAFERMNNNDDASFRVRTSPRAFGYVSRDGANAEFYAQEVLNDAFDAESNVRSRYTAVLADNLAERAIEMNSMTPGFSFFTGSGSLSDEGQEADRRSREIARMLRRDEGDADQLEAELDEVLGLVFDDKQDAQQERIDDMRQKLTELEERLEQRQSDREDIIAKRKNELLGRSSRYD